jgi:hypothetical protein
MGNFLGYPINWAVVFAMSVWLIINVGGLGHFIFLGLRLLTSYDRYQAFIKYTANEIYPEELKKYIRQAIFLTLSSSKEKDKMDEKSDYIEPEVSMWPIFNDNEEMVVTQTLSSKMKLSNINITFLNYVILYWIKKNKRLREKNEDSFNIKVPTLIFPLTPNTSYEGKIDLCRIRNGGKINFFHKYLIKKSFIFKKSKETEIMSTENALSLLKEATIKAIQSKNIAEFDVIYKQYRDFHLFLLELGEIQNRDQKLNYANMGIWLPLHSEWASNYIDIFKESVSVLLEKEHFLKKCCYTASYLADDILSMPSMTGFDSLMRVQSSLWHVLNRWWENQLEKQGKKTHNNSLPNQLMPPESKIYLQAIYAYIAGWESIQDHIVRKTNEFSQPWEQYELLFNAFKAHVEEILFSIQKAIVIGNSYGARQVAEMLMRWSGSLNLSLNGEGNDYDLVDGINVIEVTPDLLKKTWVEVQKILQERDKLKRTYSQKTVFKATLINYWKDVNISLASYLIKETLLSNAENSLSKEVLYKILKGKLDDNATHYGESVFVKNLQNYIIIFLRQHKYTHWPEAIYPNLLSRLYRKMDSFGKAEWVPGRVYSSIGDPVDNQTKSLVILAILLCKENETNILSQGIRDELNILLKDDTVASHLERILKKFTDEAKNIDLLSVTSIFADYYEKHSSKQRSTFPTLCDSKDNHIIEEILSEESASEFFKRKLDIVKKLFSDLHQNATDYRKNRIIESPISHEKLLEISEKASSQIFNKKQLKIPLSLFSTIEFTTDPLSERQLNISNFPKGTLIKPPIDPVDFSDDISSHVNQCLMWDIFNAAQSLKIIQQVSVNNEQQYLSQILEKADKIKQKGLNPIVIVENPFTPQWISNWLYFRRIRDMGYVIEQKDAQTLFHLNDIPFYASNIDFRGTLIIARQSLEKIRFREFNSGCPINVNFKVESTDSLYGSLVYSWETEAKIAKQEIYLLNYPANIVE